MGHPALCAEGRGFMRELAVCDPTHDDETVMNGAPGVVRGGERGTRAREL